MLNVICHILVTVRDHRKHISELIDTLLKLTSDHLTHEEIEICAQRQAQASISIGRLKELDPQGKING